MLRLCTRCCLIAALVLMSSVCMSACALAEDLADNWPDAVYLPTTPESQASNVQPWKPAPAQWGKMLDFYTENNIFPGVSVLVKSPKWGVRFVSSGKPILEKETIPFKVSKHVYCQTTTSSFNRLTCCKQIFIHGISASYSLANLTLTNLYSLTWYQA